MKINKCVPCGIEFVGNICPMCDAIIEDKKEEDPNLNFLEAG